MQKKRMVLDLTYEPSSNLRMDLDRYILSSEIKERVKKTKDEKKAKKAEQMAKT